MNHLLLVLPLLLALPAAGLEIEGPDEVAVGARPVRLTIEGVTVQDLVQGQGRLEYFPRAGAEIWDGATWTGAPYALAFFDRPGEYIIQVMLVKDGQLLYAEHIITANGDPGPDPKPDPDPPPPPVQGIRVVIVEDANRRSHLPYEQTQTMSLPDLRELVDEFYVVDSGVVDQHGAVPAALAPAIEATQGETLPVMVLLDTGSGAVVWQGAVPPPAAARELLRKYQPAREVADVADPVCVDGTCPTPQQNRYIQRTARDRMGRTYTYWEVAP